MEGGIIITLVALFILLLVFVFVMPIGLPFIENADVSGYDAFTIFLLFSLPFCLFFGIIWAVLIR